MSGPSNRTGLANSTDASLIQGLGWLTVALGAGPVLRPRAIARACGVDPKRRNLTLLRAVGVRELGVAAGLLTNPQPAWVWARVAQDLMDLPLAARSVVGKRGGRRFRSQATLALLTGISALDVYAAVRTSRAGSAGGAEAPEGPRTVRAAVTINRSQDQVSSRMAEADPPLSGGDVQVSYTPAPGARGTEVRVEWTPEQGGGVLGRTAATLAGSGPQQQLDDALRRFKQLLEAGEVIRSDAMPSGTDAVQQRKQRPAQPRGN